MAESGSRLRAGGATIGGRAGGVNAGGTTAGPSPLPPFPGAAATTSRQSENSEVLLSSNEASVVTNSPAATESGSLNVKEPLPLPSVFASTDPSRSCPSPFPLGSQAAFANTSIRTGGPVRVLIVPVTSPPSVAPVRTGKFWLPFAPPSPSPPSFSVTPSALRSIPRPPLARKKFRRIRLPVPEAIVMPSPPLWAITFGCSSNEPPTVPILRSEALTKTPSSSLGIGVAPSPPTPIMLSFSSEPEPPASMRTPAAPLPAMTLPVKSSIGAVSRTPSPSLPMSKLPVTSVPTLLKLMKHPDVPSYSRPFPPLPEMTLPITVAQSLTWSPGPLFPRSRVPVGSVPM